MGQVEHELKTHQQFYEAAWSGLKTFEVRKNDRNYQVGDTLILKEWDHTKEVYTGQKLRVEVTYILSDPQYVAKGFVILAINYREMC